MLLIQIAAGVFIGVVASVYFIRNVQVFERYGLRLRRWIWQMVLFLSYPISLLIAVYSTLLVWHVFKWWDFYVTEWSFKDDLQSRGILLVTGAILMFLPIVASGKYSLWCLGMRASNASSINITDPRWRIALGVGGLQLLLVTGILSSGGSDVLLGVWLVAQIAFILFGFYRRGRIGVKRIAGADE